MQKLTSDDDGYTSPKDSNKSKKYYVYYVMNCRQWREWRTQPRGQKRAKQLRLLVDILMSFKFYIVLYVIIVTAAGDITSTSAVDTVLIIELSQRQFDSYNQI